MSTKQTQIEQRTCSMFHYYYLVLRQTKVSFEEILWCPVWMPQMQQLTQVLSLHARRSCPQKLCWLPMIQDLGKHKQISLEIIYWSLYIQQSRKQREDSLRWWLVSVPTNCTYLYRLHDIEYCNSSFLSLHRFSYYIENSSFRCSLLCLSRWNLSSGIFASKHISSSRCVHLLLLKLFLLSVYNF